MKKTLYTLFFLPCLLIGLVAEGQETIGPWQADDEFEYREFKGPTVSPLIHLSCEIQREIVYVGKIVSWRVVNLSPNPINVDIQVEYQRSCSSTPPATGPNIKNKKPVQIGLEGSLKDDINGMDARSLGTGFRKQLKECDDDIELSDIKIIACTITSLKETGEVISITTWPDNKSAPVTAQVPETKPKEPVSPPTTPEVTKPATEINNASDKAKQEDASKQQAKEKADRAADDKAKQAQDKKAKDLDAKEAKDNAAKAKKEQQDLLKKEQQAKKDADAQALKDKKGSEAQSKANQSKSSEEKKAQQLKEQQEKKDLEAKTKQEKLEKQKLAENEKKAKKAQDEQAKKDKKERDELAKKEKKEQQELAKKEEKTKKDSGSKNKKTGKPDSGSQAGQSDTQAASKTGTEQVQAEPPKQEPPQAQPEPVKVSNTPVVPEVTEPPPVKTSTGTTMMEDPDDTLLIKDNVLKVNANDFREKAFAKIRDLNKKIKALSEASTGESQANRIINESVELFLNEDVLVQVSSIVAAENKKSFKVREYLIRIKQLPYTRVVVEWSKIQIVSDFVKQPDGTYTAVAQFEQKFQGLRDEQVVYSDVTEKKVTLHVKLRQKVVAGKSQSIYEVYLGDIGVVQTRRG